MDKTIFRRLTLLWRTFTPVEKAILEAVADSIPSEARPKIRRQIQSINRVQRILDWTEINLYCARRGKVAWPDEAMFDNQGEFELAKLPFSAAGREFESTLWCVGGHVFSLVIRPSIKPFCFEIPAGLTVELVSDPTSAGPRSPDLTAYLPESYLSFPHGVSTDEPINGWLVRRPSETHQVHFAAGDFIVLAERDRSEWLLAKKDTATSGIFRCLSDKEPELVKGDFATAIRSEVPTD